MNVPALLSALWERQRSDGLTNAELAAQLGVHEATISRLRRGESRQPSLDTVLAITRAYPDLAVSSDVRQGMDSMPTRTDKGVQ